MNINKYFRASCIILLMLFSFLTNTTYTQTEDSLYYTNPDYHVAKELFNRKIVMLGDYGHNQPGLYHHVYNVLENWFQMCMQKPELIHLTYIIEYDSPTVNELNKYIASGDIKSLIDLIAPDFYLENLEYYAQLRNFALQLDSVNKYRKNKLSFTVKGFEEVGYTSFEKVAKMSQKEWELWFVNERDSHTAKGMIDYVKSNSNEQILIFYGGAHLIKSKWFKNRYIPFLTKDESAGYFLAHYLTQEYGAENVFTNECISGLSLLKYNKNNDKLIRIPDPEKIDFIMKPSNLDLPDSIISGADYIYVYSIIPNLPLIEIRKIFSKIILDKTIKQINKAKVWLPGYVAANNYYKGLDNIFNLTGIHFENDTLFK